MIAGSNAVRRLVSLAAAALFLTLSTAAYANPQSSSQDIVDTAVAAGSFKTLVAALKAAGLVDTLKGKGAFNVFAPSDDAFAKLPAGTVDEFLKPQNKQNLIAILSYHVVAGKVTAAQAMKLSSEKTVNGQPLTISTDGGTVKINDPTVTQADVMCSNGVIHVIDTVLMPK